MNLTERGYPGAVLSQVKLMFEEEHLGRQTGKDPGVSRQPGLRMKAATTGQRGLPTHRPLWGLISELCGNTWFLGGPGWEGGAWPDPAHRALTFTPSGPTGPLSPSRPGSPWKRLGERYHWGESHTNPISKLRKVRPTLRESCQQEL